MLAGFASVAKQVCPIRPKDESCADLAKQSRTLKSTFVNVGYMYLINQTPGEKSCHDMALRI